MQVWWIFGTALLKVIVHMSSVLPCLLLLPPEPMIGQPVCLRG